MEPKRVESSQVVRRLTLGLFPLDSIPPHPIPSHHFPSHSTPFHSIRNEVCVGGRRRRRGRERRRFRSDCAEFLLARVERSHCNARIITCAVLTDPGEDALDDLDAIVRQKEVCQGPLDEAAPVRPSRSQGEEQPRSLRRRA
ncbi:unnamed protein product [Notodromas monacha]|uniref:Uncharacterized protein n=1 Tax=Notodromas monacha TaxID=399045 RepID=A0A7R9BNE6_9CRUS|nr:unnamed protein product [Notodromas monacha]CAG0918393.1 unnamed protein product [Notodromas monacha]